MSNQAKTNGADQRLQRVVKSILRSKAGITALYILFKSPTEAETFANEFDVRFTVDAGTWSDSQPDFTGKAKPVADLWYEIPEKYRTHRSRVQATFIDRSTGASFPFGLGELDDMPDNVIPLKVLRKD